MLGAVLHCCLLQWRLRCEVLAMAKLVCPLLSLQWTTMSIVWIDLSLCSVIESILKLSMLQAQFRSAVSERYGEVRCFRLGVC